MLVETKFNVYFIYNMYYEQLSGVLDEYILDSNIVADLEYFYYKPENMNGQKKQNLLELISFLRGKKMDYRYALTELSSNYKEGGIIEDWIVNT